MVDPKKMSVEDVLAACRGGTPAGPPQAETKGPKVSKPAPDGPSAEAVPEVETSSGTRSDEPAPTKPAGKPAAGKPGSMSVADILAAARQGSAPAASSEKPAPAAKPAPKEKGSPAVKPAAKSAGGAESAAASGPKDTSSILAAARKAVKPGPMSKEEAKLRATVPPETPAKAMPVRPTKPAYAVAVSKEIAPPARREFFAVIAGSFLAIGFASMSLTSIFWLLGLARFMFPNVLTEPPSKFKVGFAADFAPDTVSDNFKAQFGVWVVNMIYKGQRQIVALRTVCTHLGCTPNWLEAEQKFKCPCHGSGFYKDGVNFEGPAPRPLERYAIQLADDGQIEIDKSRIFYAEKGDWGDTASYVTV